ncbi:alpha/beta hydrolase [uncultured Tateyamaria sp.]|uniref:alpha/beta fold hydrolase n=1 Tax=Tateyamaria sp. 1078 TaxID=3417464 RepID=UPI002639246D|nr:alpha/beta hydrolase [uncultured Tateyamaria sp.]
MTLKAAPLFTDFGAGPADGAAYWLKTSDGVRIRIGVWPASKAVGTVLLFCGRTEYVEKYGIAAHELVQRGYTTVVVDWRGQGLADRLLGNTSIGHVEDFGDYQKDVAAVLNATRTLDLPEPLYLLGHSMGGSIGLRALYEGLPVAAAAFTGPMWGIAMAAYLRPVAWSLGRAMPAAGLGNVLAPGTSMTHYVLASPFEDNTLTRDREMWQMMQDQLRAHPELALGGPSVTWLRKALDDTNALSLRPSPDLPCVTFMGDNERIVDVGRVHARMAQWPKGTLHVMQDAEHEVIMEDAATRTWLFDTMVQTFAEAG